MSLGINLRRLQVIVITDTLTILLLLLQAATLSNFTPGLKIPVYIEIEMVKPLKQSQENSDQPFVSVITPTYNRRRFIPHLIQCYKQQTYPLDRMEWIILDDGQEKVKDFFDTAAKYIPNIRYISSDEKKTIGAKRNLLNKLALGDIIVAMDDDDYYAVERVEAAVKAFKKNPQVELAGSTEIYMYYTDIKTIYKLGPYNPNHATNGTMAWRSSYAKTHTYDENVLFAEEKSFLEDYKHPMIQLDPFKVMLVMSHSENTFDKKKLREQEEQMRLAGKENPVVHKTTMKIEDFIKDKMLRDFFRDA
jgi:glycosyltransferase involved in cell wall biosynthesis